MNQSQRQAIITHRNTAIVHLDELMSKLITARQSGIEGQTSCALARNVEEMMESDHLARMYNNILRCEDKSEDDIGEVIQHLETQVREASEDRRKNAGEDLYARQQRVAEKYVLCVLENLRMYS